MYSPPWDPYCPQGGDFFACGNGSKFVGCCDHVSPCTISAGCSAENLRQTSFDSSKYGTFADQQCSAGLFYTCASTTPDAFFGCCTVNPCVQNGCPDENLTGAYLSDNITEAAEMDPYPPVDSMPTSVPSTTDFSTSPTSPSSSTLSDETTAATATTRGPSTESQSVPVGIIAGSAAGGFALLCIVAAILWFLRRHTTRPNAQYNREPGADTSFPYTVNGAYIGNILGRPLVSATTPAVAPHQDSPSNVPVYQSEHSGDTRYLASTHYSPSPRRQLYKDAYLTPEVKAIPQYRPYSPFNNDSSHHAVHPQITSPLSHRSDPTRSSCWSNSINGVHPGRCVDSQYGTKDLSQVYHRPPQELEGGIDVGVVHQSVGSGFYNLSDGRGGSWESSRPEDVNR